MNLSDSELRFLGRHGFSPDDVLDARGLSVRDRKRLAEANGKSVLLGSPCEAGGHRLRTKYGHCLECNPQGIAHIRRHSVESSVYVAYSRSLGISKIGISSQSQRREETLNAQGYAGARDWETLLRIDTTEAGRVEARAQSALNTFRVYVEYTKGDQHQTAREAFRCTPKAAVDAVIDALTGLSLTPGKIWTNPKWR